MCVSVHSKKERDWEGESGERNFFVQDENVTCNISKKHNKWMMTGKSTFYEIYFNVMLTFHLLSRSAWYGVDKRRYTPAYNSACLMKINEWPKCLGSPTFTFTWLAPKILKTCAEAGKAEAKHTMIKNNLCCFFLISHSRCPLLFLYINIHNTE